MRDGEIFKHFNRLFTEQTGQGSKLSHFGMPAIGMTLKLTQARPEFVGIAGIFEELDKKQLAAGQMRLLSFTWL